MRPHLKLSYTKKYKTFGATEPADVKGILEEFLPAGEEPALPAGKLCFHMT